MKTQSITSRRLTRAHKERIWLLRRTFLAALAGTLLGAGVLIAVPAVLGTVHVSLVALGGAFVLGSLVAPPVIELASRLIAPWAAHDELPSWRALYGSAMPRAIVWSALFQISISASVLLWLAAVIWAAARALSSAVTRDGEAHVTVGRGPFARRVALDAVIAVTDLDVDHVARTGVFRERVRLFDRSGGLIGALAPGRPDHDELARALLERREGASESIHQN